MVNELKLAFVHFTHQSPMQICACTWIYLPLDKKLWKIRIGPPGLRAAGRWAFGPLGRRAIAGHGPRAGGLFLAKPLSMYLS